MSLSAFEPYPTHASQEECAAAQTTIAQLQSEVDNLQVALQSARKIGIAMGIVMAAHKVTSEAAFDLLRTVSQCSHRKLRDVADEVGLTGALPDPAVRRGAASAHVIEQRARPRD